MTVLWERTVRRPRWARPLREFDVYFMFREAFIRHPEVRLCTRRLGDGGVRVVIERDGVSASVVVPLSVLILRAEKNIRWAARDAVRHFNGAAVCFGKVRYLDQAEADHALIETLMRSMRGLSRNRRETHSYLCPHCDGWHLTSRVPEDA